MNLKMGHTLRSGTHTRVTLICLSLCTFKDVQNDSSDLHFGQSSTSQSILLKPGCIVEVGQGNAPWHASTLLLEFGQFHGPQCSEAAAHQRVILL